MHSICENLKPSLLNQCPQLKISNINQIPKSNHRLVVHAEERWRRKSRLCFMFQFASGGVLAFAIYALLGDGFTKYMAPHHSVASQSFSGFMQEHHNSTLFKMAHSPHAGHFCPKVCLTPSPTFSLTTMETPSRCKSNISHSVLDKSGEIEPSRGVDTY